MRRIIIIILVVAVIGTIVYFTYRHFKGTSNTTNNMNRSKTQAEKETPVSGNQNYQNSGGLIDVQIKAVEAKLNNAADIASKVEAKRELDALMEIAKNNVTVMS